MNLFDVLKYPISVPPTMEELEALPADLLINWMLAVNFDADMIRLNSSELTNAEWAFSVYNGDHESEDLIILGQMIKEYEPI
jgi:hypothetical protein